ncbi:hypothetical protein N3K66_008018 [Trichothecium roseum]|uniref:Uncharacterized protein n=1 Tax=Trichothecium roseum TaxID=47278 RepID=A0ACC0USB6_9HYPO|nr:hypothetical protein N3K66_008018 [Trichothecium roseum]
MVKGTPESNTTIANIASVHSAVLLCYADGARTIANAPQPPPAIVDVSWDAHPTTNELPVVFSSLKIYLVAARGLVADIAGSLGKLHEELAESRDDDDDSGDDVGSRLAAGSALVMLRWRRKRLTDLKSTIYAKFYAFRYDRVPAALRVMYADVLVLLTYCKLLAACVEGRADVVGEEKEDEEKDDGDDDEGDVLDYVVEKLDRALITSGQAGTLGGTWIEGTLMLLDEFSQANSDGDGDDDDDDRHPPDAKRRKKESSEEEAENVFSSSSSSSSFFSEEEPYGRPALTPSRECPRHEGWSLDRFEDYMNEPAAAAATTGSAAPRPLVFTDLLRSWPALSDRPWRSVSYLLSRTLGGRRLVPVELGRSYVDAGWSQELMPFGRFLRNHVLLDAPQQQQQEEQQKQKRAYLAQHDLLGQIPCLRRDVAVPDLCWADVPPHPAGGPGRDRPKLGSPSLNAWFGPAGTITPLHTDAYHNLLAQVVGSKYVRLYPPGAAAAMRPRGEEHGVDMSNTSAVDLGVVEGWDEPPEDEDGDGEGYSGVERDREALRGVEYWECVLGPGDTLLIPMGWWHYVRSLSISFSVSFWWN